MSYFNTEKPPEKWSAAYFRMFVERARQAINYIDGENFPGGLPGSLLNSKTVSTGALSNFAYEQCFCALAVPYTTASITEVDVGALVLWSPSAWSDKAKLIFEVVGGINVNTATAVFALYDGTTKLAELTSSDGAISLIRSSAFTPPTTAKNLRVKFRTTNSSVVALITSAKLIVVPQ